MITGGTGSFGKRFVEEVVTHHNPNKVIIYSRDEMKQYEFEQALDNNAKAKVRFFIGDVRDRQRLITAMNQVDIVIHAAALKHVPAAEYNPFEAVQTNVVGAQNVIDAAMTTGVQKVISLSTDKAAAPINLYGATKLTSDKLFISANQYAGGRGIKFSVVRYGNVMFSRGSVVPFFVKRKASGVLPITDARMTRFSITLDEGVEFVCRCLDRMWGGELFVPKIPSYRIADVAEAVDPNCNMEIVGMRPGEKLHEEMITETDAFNTADFGDYYVILPTAAPSWDVEQFLLESGVRVGHRVAEGFRYTSVNNDRFLSVHELRRLIEREMERNMG